MVWWRKEKAGCKAELGCSTLWHLESDRGSFSEANYMRFGLPGGSDGKESACNVGDLGWEDPLEEGMATHSSILAWRVPMDRGAWWARVHGVAKSQTE